MAATNYASRYKRNTRNKNQNLVLIVLLSGAVIAVALVVFTGVIGFMGLMAPDKPRTRFASPQIQQERLTLIVKLESSGVFQKVKGHRVYVGSGFYLATFDQKQSFISLCSAYAFKVPKNESGRKDEWIWVYDGMTGKKIGSYGLNALQAGLVLD